jgi:hypothetical protein
MDKIIANLKRENICSKCHELLDVKPEFYDDHVKNCKDEPSDVITTKFYTEEEMVYKSGLKKLKSFIIKIINEYNLSQ